MSGACLPPLSSSQAPRELVRHCTPLHVTSPIATRNRYEPRCPFHSWPSATTASCTITLPSLSARGMSGPHLMVQAQSQSARAALALELAWRSFSSRGALVPPPAVLSPSQAYTPLA